MNVTSTEICKSNHVKQSTIDGLRSTSAIHPVYISIAISLRRASDFLRCFSAFSTSPIIFTDSESRRKRTCWTNHRLRWNNDEWLMRRLRPPLVREGNGGRGNIGQDATVLRCAMCHPPPALSPPYPPAAAGRDILCRCGIASSLHPSSWTHPVGWMRFRGDGTLRSG